MSGRLPSGILGFFGGAWAVIRGAGDILADPKLRKLAIIPILLTAVLYLALVIGAGVYADDLLGKIWSRPEGWLRFLWYALIPFVFVALLAPFVLLFSTITGMIGNSFYERMVVHVLSRHSIRIRESGFIEGMFSDVARSLLFTIAGSLCALLALLPFIGIVFAMLGTLIACFNFGSAAVNPVLKATGAGFADRIAFLFRSFMLVLGIGTSVALMLLIPLAGLIAIPAAVVGATELSAQSMRGA